MLTDKKEQLWDNSRNLHKQFKFIQISIDKKIDLKNSTNLNYSNLFYCLHENIINICVNMLINLFQFYRKILFYSKIVLYNYIFIWDIVYNY